MIALIFQHWTEELHVIAQAVVAMLLGGLLGWERETAGKLMGLRTHMLVCMASMLFVRLGQILLADTAGQFPHGTVRADPAHLIAAVAAGISFIGGGAIFRNPSGGQTRGLTTAASLLSTASIGVAVAVDRYILAVGTVLLTLFILHTLQKLNPKNQQEEKDSAASQEPPLP